MERRRQAAALHSRGWNRGTRLYDELKPYHTRIPALAIHLVAYEYPLDYLVPPATLIMTVQEGQPDFQEFRERVLAGAASAREEQTWLAFI